MSYHLDTGPDLQVITPEWPAPRGVRAAFTLRTGGVSVAPYDSLNLGARIGDSAEAGAENRRRVREKLRLPAEPVWLEQVHGIEVVELGAVVVTGDSRGRTADASVARGAGRVCVIHVADCMPVLFAARDGSAVGAAHAGWRGLAGGGLEETVRQLAVPPEQLIAWLRPTIGQGHFEVGEDVRSAFVLRDPDAASAFETNARGR